MTAPLLVIIALLHMFAALVLLFRRREERERYEVDLPDCTRTLPFLIT